MASHHKALADKARRSLCRVSTRESYRHTFAFEDKKGEPQFLHFYYEIFFLIFFYKTLQAIKLVVNFNPLSDVCLSAVWSLHVVHHAYFFWAEWDQEFTRPFCNLKILGTNPWHGRWAWRGRRYKRNGQSLRTRYKSPNRNNKNGV
jgi:hypothetical protein